MIGASSGVTRDIPAQKKVSGYPAIDHQKWLKANVLFSQLDDFIKQIRKVHNQVSKLIGKYKD